MRRLTLPLLALVFGALGAALVLLIGNALGGGNGRSEQTRMVTVQSGSGEVRVVPVSAPAGGLSATEVYSNSIEAIVQVQATFNAGARSGIPLPPDHPGGPAEPQAIGSGFVVSSDGFILTNAHVITTEEPKVEKAKEVSVIFKNQSRAKAEIVGYDLRSDVALLKIDAKGRSLATVPLGDSSKVLVGEPVYAIGSPFKQEFSLTSGIVSAINRQVDSPDSSAKINNAIQTDAAINRGNSGGPLFNAQGEVIGINEQIATTSMGSEGVGFAVPINTAKRVMEQLQKRGEVEYAWLGVAGFGLTDDFAGKFSVPVTRGVLVERVISGSPAASANLKGGERFVTYDGEPHQVGGDVILKFDEQPVTTMAELTEAVAERLPGDEITLTYQRGDKVETARIKLDRRPKEIAPQ